MVILNFLTGESVWRISGVISTVTTRCRNGIQMCKMNTQTHLTGQKLPKPEIRNGRTAPTAAEQEAAESALQSGCALN
jgi:hypothetical protein